VFDRPDHVAASPSDRAREALVDDATRSNREIAIAVRCQPVVVARCRSQLTDLGVLPPGPYERRGFPVLKALPRPPRILQEGACVGRDPAPWTEPDHPDREEARSVCRTACHVAEACLSWSLSLPQSDRGIYAGTTSTERERLKREHDGQPVPVWLTSAAKNAARDHRRRAAAAAAAQAAG
jgi:hypothetical protein